MQCLVWILSCRPQETPDWVRHHQFCFLKRVFCLQVKRRDWEKKWVSRAPSSHRSPGLWGVGAEKAGSRGPQALGFARKRLCLQTPDAHRLQCPCVIVTVLQSKPVRNPLVGSAPPQVDYAAQNVLFPYCPNVPALRWCHEAGGGERGLQAC